LQALCRFSSRHQRSRVCDLLRFVASTGSAWAQRSFQFSGSQRQMRPCGTRGQARRASGLRLCRELRTDTEACARALQTRRDANSTTRDTEIFTLTLKGWNSQAPPSRLKLRSQRPTRTKRVHTPTRPPTRKVSDGALDRGGCRRRRACQLRAEPRAAEPGREHVEDRLESVHIPRKKACYLF
jgi:hypothetical protein